MSHDVDTPTAAPTAPPGWTAEASPPPPPAEPPAPARTGLGGRMIAAIGLVSAGVALLIAALVISQIRLHNANSLDSARASALVAAKTFSVELSTYDYHHLDQDFSVVVDHSTGKFKSDFAKASKDLEPLITKYEATSTGTVSAAGISDATTNQATVIVFVDQTVKNSNATQPRIDRNRLRLTLTNVNGTWLVDRVEIL